MFRKKTSPDARSRQRLRPDHAQRNTAVFSYYSARSRRTDNTGRGNEESPASPRGFRRLVTPRRLLRLLGVLVLLGLAANAMLVNPEPQVIIADDDEGQLFLQEHHVYERAAAAIIAPSPLNRNKITFDVAGVSNQMRAQFPELASVTVRLPFMSRQPIVHIQALAPTLILEGGNGTFMLDHEGRAFLPESSLSPGTGFDLPVVRDESGLALQAEEIALSERETRFITEVARQFRAQDVEVAGMTLPAGGGELTVHVQDKPYIVRFNLYGDAREGAGRYFAAQEYLQGRNEVPEAYIDVRVDNRVYVQ